MPTVADFLLVFVFLVFMTVVPSMVRLIIWFAKGMLGKNDGESQKQDPL